MSIDKIRRSKFSLEKATKCCGKAYKFSRKGIVLIWTVLVILILIAIVGLVLDIGLGFLAGHHLQNAADAASLAGAMELGSGLEELNLAAYTIAQNNDVVKDDVLLAMNLGNAAGGDIVVGYYDREQRLFTPTLDGPNAVKVVARRTAGSPGGALPIVFGPAFGVNTINVQRTAIAMLGGSTGSGLIVLHENDDRTFRLSGDVTLDVRDVTTSDGLGDIQVNSDSISSLKADGNPTLVAGAINVHAEDVNDPPDFDGDVNTNQTRIPDPLADLDPPAVPTATYTGTSYNTGTHTLQPGYYPEGISMTGGTVSLEPGIYYLDGVGLNITGGNLVGDDVMIYVVDSAGNPPSTINLTGNGTIDITPTPLDSGPYGGILLWQAAGNTNDVNIKGTEQFTGLEGTVYLPTSRLNLTGTSDSFSISQIITSSINISGTGSIFINYDGRYPAVGRDVFLVE